jgi:sugar/nucleoside kinase (ribokinase family)
MLWKVLSVQKNHPFLRWRRGLQDHILEKLQRFLRSGVQECSVVVMPDFFLDRLVNVNWNPQAFSENAEKILERKGGSIDGIEQTELRGGNAVNTASALAALGFNAIPIVCTDGFGLRLMKFYLKSRRVDLSHVKTLDHPSITTAMEFKTKYGKGNVMLRDLGSLANFGPQNLDSHDFEAIENADHICVFNWAGTRHFGTELAKTVFRRTRKNGRGRTYFDTADPTPNEEKIPELVKNVLQTRDVDVLSVNENEAICYALALSDEMKQSGKGLRFWELAKKAARILALRLSARVDLHTTLFAGTFTEKDETIVPAFKVPVLRATGAGDAWNAGNIVGDAHKLSDECRLTLANVAAACYVSSPSATHPTAKELMKFLEKQRRKGS